MKKDDESKIDLSGYLTKNEDISPSEEGTIESNLKYNDVLLKQKTLQEQILNVELEIERHRLERMQDNSEKRPKMFRRLILLIGIFYGLGLFLIIKAIYPFWDPFFDLSQYPVPVQTFQQFEHFYNIALLLLFIVPTVLTAMLMKAVYSSDKSKDNEVSILDSVPAKLISSIDKAS